MIDSWKIKPALFRVCVLSVFLLTGSLLKAQAPANDNCSNANLIVLGNNGYQIGLIRSDTFAIDSATVQTGEFFHNSLVTAGNDKKSVWFKFYIPTRRAINIELKQDTNAIGIKDCGFTTYLANACLPTSTQATAAKLTTLNQFGSSFHPCMDPGWYLVQVSAKTRAAGNIFLEITTSFPYQYSSIVNAEYDEPDSAYDFGNALVGKTGLTTAFIDFELGCYTVEDSTELFPDLGKNYRAYNQSAWFTFTAQNDADDVEFALKHVTGCSASDTMALRLFKGDCRKTSNLTLLDSSFNDWSAKYVCYPSPCYDYVKHYRCMFDSGQVYSVQLLFHKDLDKNFRFKITDRTSAFAGYPRPTTSVARDLDTLKGLLRTDFGFSCKSRLSDTKCGTANQPVTISGKTYNLSEWWEFDLDEYSRLSFYIHGSANRNTREVQNVVVRLFKDTITSNCSDVDVSNLIATMSGASSRVTLNCLEPGKYLLQMLGIDSIRPYCSGNMHLGTDLGLDITQSKLPGFNRFALNAPGKADSVYNLDPLPNYTYVNTGTDTVACFDAVQPEQSCDTTKLKRMYRVFRIGDVDGDGIADSGMVTFENLHSSSASSHRLYKGNALQLRASQSITGYPDTLKGLNPITKCFPGYYRHHVCLEPGDYTLVSSFDESMLGDTETPRVTFHSSKPKFDAYAKAELFDTIRTYGSMIGAHDTFSCKQNPDTIDGVSCGYRNHYHVFYLDTVAVTSIYNGLRYGEYGNITLSLFKGDIRKGRSGLKHINEDRNWRCVTYGQSTSDCKPLQPGWYTIVVSQHWNMGYDSAEIASTNQYSFYRYPYRISISTRAPNVTLPKYYRPSLAASIDSLINKNQPLDYDTNYSAQKNLKLHLKKYSGPQEILECDLDTPITYFPRSRLCDTTYTNIVYYVFSLKNRSGVRINPGFSGANWKAQLYAFDVRKDSAKIGSVDPLQNCNYNANYLEFCDLMPGTYSLVFMCKRRAGERYTVNPTIFIDSVATSRFDHARNAYDFGAVPGDGKFHDGRIGEVHPNDTTLPASHDLITCRTGAQLSDPTYSSCSYTEVNPFVYSGDSNVVLYPYDSAYLHNNGTRYNPWEPIKRNLWYSFAINGYGSVTIKLKGNTSPLLAGFDRSFRFSVYESDENGRLTLAQLRSQNKIDSTLADGLKYITRDWQSAGIYYCNYGSDHTATFTIDGCDTVKPRRFYVLVDWIGTAYRNYQPQFNANVWLEVKYDSIALPQTRFDHYSDAGKIDGLREVNLLQNPSFENSYTYWSISPFWGSVQSTPLTATNGNNYFSAHYFYTSGLATLDLLQNVNVSAYARYINTSQATANFTGDIRADSVSATHLDRGRLLIEYLNVSGTVIGRDSSKWYANTKDWVKASVSATIPSGTVNCRVKAQAAKTNTGVTDWVEVYFDNFRFTVNIPNDSLTTPLRSAVTYRGESTYFTQATLDSADFNRDGRGYSCNDTSVARSVWYKFKVDSTGYIQYNYMYRNGVTYQKYNIDYNSSVLQLYREVIKGDSVKGLEIISPSTGGSNPFVTILSGYYLRACIEPGTYYLRLNKCNVRQCIDEVIPQVAFDFYPVTPTPYDFYSTANDINKVAGNDSIFKSQVLYKGARSYFQGATLDSTDHNRVYTYSCSDPAYAKTLWYKFRVDTAGYLFYNFRVNGTSSVVVDPYRIKLYRSTIPGDSINGLEYVPRYSYTSKYSPQYGSQMNYVCVQTGIYYLQINSCNAHQCIDFVEPQLVFELHPGDRCTNAIPLVMDTIETVSDRLIVNCHSIGDDFGEDGSNMGCLYGPQGYKSSWFFVDYTDTTKVDLEFSLAEYTSAKASEIRYRTYYGNCQSLTPAPCNNNALTSFVIDCIRKGTYYVQVVTPDDATGELEMTVRTKENTDTTCNPVDIFQPNAAFAYNTSCPENFVEFINTSSRGDSIRYFWDFGYAGLTDTALNPVVAYPALPVEKSYTVKLIVEHITRGSRDSLELDVSVPYAPELRIDQNDTIICAGDSVRLSAHISHSSGIWNTGDSTTSITVSKTGWYSYDMIDKPQLLNNGSFEQNPRNHRYWKQSITGGTWNYTSSRTYGWRDSTYALFFSHGSANTGIYEIEQYVDVSHDSVEIDSGIAKTSLTFWLRGYLNYEDEGQVILEYLDSGNNLLAIYRSGLEKPGNYWEQFVHSRTTPKSTRKLRVRIQVNKLNTSTSTAFVFFDGFLLRMRSACSYKDSVFVQVNQLPQVALPNDTFFCLGDSFLVRTQNSYHDPYVIQDSMLGSIKGTLRNNARREYNKEYVTLTLNNDNETGQIEYEDSSLTLNDSFTVTFDFWEFGLKCGYTTYFYLFNSATPTQTGSRTGGLLIDFSTASNNWVAIYWNGSRYYYSYTGIDFDNAEWRTVRIEYKNKTINVYIGSKLVGAYTFTASVSQSGYKFGLGAWNYLTCTNEHRVRNFTISRDNPKMVYVPDVDTTDFKYSWNNVVGDSVRWVIGTTTLKTQITDPYGCKSNTDSIQVRAVRQYDSLFTSIEQVCSELDSFRLTPIDPNGYFYGHSAVDSSGLVHVANAGFGNNTIYFSVVDTFGCTLRDTGYFVVDSVPDILIDSVGAVCKNEDPFRLIVNDSNGYFYGGVFVDSMGNFDPSEAVVGWNKVYYKTFGSDCVGSDSLLIRVDSLPDASISMTGPYCANAGVQRLVAAINGGGKFSATAYVDTMGWFDPAIAGAGVHRVFYTYADGNGCSNRDSAMVRVDSIPDATIAAAGPYCANAGVQRLVAAINSGGKFSAAAYIDTMGWFDPGIAGAGVHRVFYAYTDGNGCSNMDSAIVRVDSIPDASIAMAGPYCANAGVQRLVAAINSGGKFSGTTYVDTMGWFDPAIAGVGVHRIYYTYTDGNGCSNMDSTTIRVDSIPDASIAPVGPFCLNTSPAQLSARINAGGRFVQTSYLDTNGWFTPLQAGIGSHRVFYSFTDGNQCSNTDSLNIQVDSLPDASITAAGPFCKNGGLELLTARVHSGGVFTATGYLDTLGNFNPWTADTGLHRVYYTLDDGNGCSNTDSTTIRVDSIPDASITPAGPFCANSNIQLLTSNTNSGGRFTLASYIDTLGNFDPSIAQAGTHKIFYSFTDGNGCSNTDSTTIRVDSIPDASITPVGPFCANANTQRLRPNTNTGGRFTATSYLDTLGNFDPSIAQAGIHKIFYSFTDSNGCSNTDSTTVRVDTIPDASIAPAGPFCKNANDQTLRPNTNTGGRFSPTAYLDTLGNFDPWTADVGSHKIYYSFTDGNGCSNTDSFVVMVDSIPDASITPAGPFCKNGGMQTLSAAVNISGKFTANSYLDTLGNFDPWTADVGSHRIYYSFTDGNGCSNTDSSLVMVDSIPDASITPAGPFCANSNIQLLTSKINSGGRFTPTAYIDSLGNFNPGVAQTGTHKVFYSFTDGNQCSNTDSLNIEVDSVPDASIAPAGPFCKNANNQSLRPNTNTGGKFSPTVYLDTLGNFDPWVAGVGSHKVYYTLDDGNGCKNTDSIDIQVDSIPDASIAMAGPICANAGVQRLVAAINGGGKFFATAYVDTMGWFDPAIAGVGVHRVFYTFTDGNGCSNTDSTVIQVDTVPDASIIPAGPFCKNAGVQLLRPRSNFGGRFTATGYLDVGGRFDPALGGIGSNPVEYIFTDGNNCSDTGRINITIWDIPDASFVPIGPFCQQDQAVQIVSTTTGGVFSGGPYVSTSGMFSPDLATIGSNKVYHNLSDANGCSSSDSTLVEVYPMPDNTLSIDPEEGCEPLEVQFSTQPADRIRWQIGTEVFVDQTDVRTVLQAGSYILSLEVINAQGCSIVLDTPIIVHPKPTAQFTHSPEEVYLDDPTFYFTDGSYSNIVGWNWSFGDGNYASEKDPQHRYETGGEYLVHLYVEDMNGCMDSTELTVTVRDNLVVFIPTAFSPGDQDVLNQQFRVSGVGYSKVQCRIFNRWGEKLIDSDNFTSWDGTYMGTPVQSGIYVYQLTLTDHRGLRHYRNGTVQVIR